MISYIENEKLSFEEYCDFLKRSDLGELYPKDDLEERIEKLLTSRSVAITARNAGGKLIGIAFGITDFVYYLFVADLGVDRNYTGQGIGKGLLTRLHKTVSDKYDITVVTISHIAARGFYKKCGYVSEDCLFWKPAKSLD